MPAITRRATSARATSARATSARATSARATIFALLVTFLLSACGSATSDATIDGGEAVNYTYVIPNGTAERIDAGEPVQIVPARLDINIGDSIEIVNRDSQGHNVGPFFVGEGETVSQTFRSAAEYVDACSVHPSGEFTIVVT